ncbi:MAG: hypothetical protein MJ206_03950 [Bacilli bacterium]|nr:hypothetical protein [Bacilli bacterium]
MIKKLAFFLILFVPFTSLFSCQKTLDDKIDSQEELEKAMLFTDIEYLQCDFLGEKQTRRQNEYSPSVFHKITNGPENSNVYYELTPDGKCYLYEYEDDEWSKTSTSPEAFNTPRILAGQLHFDQVIELVHYDDFTYKNGQYTDKVKIEGVTIDYALKFLDNKLIFFSSTRSNGEKEEGSFTYNQSTPELPEVDS